jgi:hypothetical protein
MSPRMAYENSEYCTDLTRSLQRHCVQKNRHFVQYNSRYTPSTVFTDLFLIGVSLPSEAEIHPISQGSSFFYAVEISGDMIRTIETEFGGDLSNTVIGRD